MDRVQPGRERRAHLDFQPGFLADLPAERRGQIGLALLNLAAGKIQAETGIVQQQELAPVADEGLLADIEGGVGSDGRVTLGESPDRRPRRLSLGRVERRPRCRIKSS